MSVDEQWISQPISCVIGDGVGDGVYREHGIPTARMDHPDGPICACGRPSRHESGWCGISCAFADGCTGCVKLDNTIHGREHHR